MGEPAQPSARWCPRAATSDALKAVSFTTSTLRIIAYAQAVGQGGRCRPIRAKLKKINFIPQRKEALARLTLNNIDSVAPGSWKQSQNKQAYFGIQHP